MTKKTKLSKKAQAALLKPVLAIGFNGIVDASDRSKEEIKAFFAALRTLNKKIGLTVLPMTRQAVVRKMFSSRKLTSIINPQAKKFDSTADRGKALADWKNATGYQNITAMTSSDRPDFDMNNISYLEPNVLNYDEGLTGFIDFFVPKKAKKKVAKKAVKKAVKKTSKKTAKKAPAKAKYKKIAKKAKPKAKKKLAK